MISLVHFVAVCIALIFGAFAAIAVLIALAMADDRRHSAAEPIDADPAFARPIPEHVRQAIAEREAVQ